MRGIAIFAILIALGAMYLTVGQWALIGGLMIIILGHEFGHWAVARAFGIPVPVFSIGFGSTPRIKLGTFWGTEFQITPWLFGGYVQINPNDEVFASHAAWKRASVLVAGVTMNAIMAVAFLAGAYVTIGKPTGNVIVSHVEAAAPAAQAGLRDGDLIVNVDGVRVQSMRETIDAVQKHSDGSSIHIDVKRGSETVSVAVTPQSGHIGVQLGESRVFERVGISEATTRGFSDTWFLTAQTAKGFGQMVGLVEKPKAAEGEASVHGIVGIVQIGGQAFENGMFSFIWLLAALNINLMFLNLLPLPLLDGGHLAYIGWEKLTGRKVSIEWQARVAGISLALLVALMLFGLYNDLMFPVGK